MMTFGQLMYVSFWTIAGILIVMGGRFLFASEETLLRNADKMHTNNPLVARIVCMVYLVVGIALGLFMLTIPWPF